jgi:hypothetical protein
MIVGTQKTKTEKMRTFDFRMVWNDSSELTIKNGYLSCSENVVYPPSVWHALVHLSTHPSCRARISKLVGSASRGQTLDFGEPFTDRHTSESE